MSIVLRIEHSVTMKGLFNCKQYGIYSDYYNDIFVTISQRHGDGNFPTPEEDKGIEGDIEKDEFCSFKSVEQIQQWFTKEELTYLHSKGFRILMIDVNFVREGEYQILFKKEFINSVKDVSELFI